MYLALIWKKLNTMKKILLPIILISLFTISCSKKNCKDCTGCLTKADAELCEEDFEKTSDYNDKIDDMVSDGCTCSDK